MARAKKGTELSVWEPFRDDFFRGWPLSRLAGPLLEGANARWAPAVDISEDESRYVVSVELAGAKRDDVSVELQDNVLTIRGEKRSEREEKKEQQRYVERSFGSFARSFALPANVAGDAVKATFSDGVLTVRIPKKEESKPRTIAVK